MTRLGCLRGLSKLKPESFLINSSGEQKFQNMGGLLSALVYGVCAGAAIAGNPVRFNLFAMFPEMRCMLFGWERRKHVGKSFNIAFWRESRVAFGAGSEEAFSAKSGFLEILL